MDYLPTNENPVFIPGNRVSDSKWISFSTHIFIKCMDDETPLSEISSYFPGITFFGPLVGDATEHDMHLALSILKNVRNAHEKLRGGRSFISKSNREAHERAEEVEATLTSGGFISLEQGEGYSEGLNPEYSVPQCHIYRCEIPLSVQYAKWLEPRIASYEAVGSMLRTDPVYYLQMSHRIELIDTDGLRILRIDVYGSQSLLSDWEKWLEEYEGALPEDEKLSGLEFMAGLLHLADTLSTIHLISATPIVRYGAVERKTAQDNLTDFWLKCYDPGSDANYSIGSCEVCGKLFIGSSKRKRGHVACMNRQRVMRAKARKYSALVEKGMSESEAGITASIAPATAQGILNELR